MFESDEAHKQHRKLMRQARKRRYKKNLKNNPSRAGVLEKANDTIVRCKVKRYCDYTVIALRFTVVSYKLRAFNVTVKAGVAAICELKTTRNEFSSNEADQCLYRLQNVACKRS